LKQANDNWQDQPDFLGIKKPNTLFTHI